ncbi:hypothetical protein C900_05358 [Fulvivirga imtechensis AK7]|uniref:Uncharacterized protein n=1 Tax=Fulvivirga imtechensis AK7 TaxID=1237149 RepID=L8JP49_9BACT|nr:hypothetical protein [Fulvivirga imtechensis]ELR69162.1 hypothetical protein C900_05358 [Fulvivirga imtechensis AK7]
MINKLLLKLIAFLYNFTYEGVYLDDVNKKMIRPVPRLIIDGKQYYEFLQPADIPQNRFVHYLDFREESEMGVTRELLNKYIQELIKANDNHENSRIGSLLYMLQSTVNDCTPIEVLYNMASLMYFDKDEDISCYDLDYNQEKIRKFKKLPDQGFFLRTLCERSLKLTGKSLPKDIDLYLRLSKVKLNAYQQMLTGN